jgi:hypothetical protein
MSAGEQRSLNFGSAFDALAQVARVVQVADSGSMFALNRERHR